MSKSRAEQIREEAFKHGMTVTTDDPYQDEVFVAGAEWADANPIEPAVSAKIRNEIIANLEAQLALAIEALNLGCYRHHALCDKLCVRLCPVKIRKEALVKIGEMNE